MLPVSLEEQSHAVFRDITRMNIIFMCCPIVDPLPPKRVLRANETRVLVLELEERVEYVFRVSANTSIGRGQAREAFITTGPQPGQH